MVKLFAYICLGFAALSAVACGGYEAADADDLEAGTGQIVGVLVDSNGKADPNATIQAVAIDGVEVVASNNMDSDGSFSLYPPGGQTYNLIGSFGDTEKVIRQGVTMTEELTGINVGTLKADTVAGIAVLTEDADGDPLTNVKIEVIGTPLSRTTVDQGAGVLAGIPAGTFTIKFSKDGYQDLKLENIALEAEEALDLGTVTLEDE